MQASNVVLGFMNMGWPEITIILVVFILLFGAKRLPELARGVGKSIKEFKKATSGLEEEVRNAIEEDPKPTVSKPAAEKEKSPAEK